MHRYLKRFARKNGIEYTVDNGNIYMTKNSMGVDVDIFPCMVAHTDTVHPIIDEFVVNVEGRVYTGKDRKTGNKSGVGGDDKVGVAIALHALLTFPAMKVAFFRDEEVGCAGSNRADMSFFDDVAFVIQCDRRGNSDVTRSIMGLPMYGHEFAAALEPIMQAFNFREVDGMMTDVWMLRRNGLKVAAFNMSAGYYNAHSDHEYVQLDDVDKAVSFVEYTIRALSYQRWETPNDIFSPFSIEEEDDQEESELEFVRRWAGFRSASWDADACPNCGSQSLDYDDTVELHYCLSCCDYIILDGEPSETYDANYREIKI
jgi:hypothetical protein